MLKRGKQNAKLGDKVTTRMWKGMTIYSLSLEERATCPTDCEQWDNCYGDNMPFAHRFDHTHPNFIPFLEAQLEHLNNKHSEGFVVRLHVLGDFYDKLYAMLWQVWINKFKNLHVFGYTHHKSTTPLGEILSSFNDLYPNQFRIRFSDDPDTEFSAHVNEWGSGIECPEQQGKTDSCATCGYCWSSALPVIFIEH